MSSSRGNKRAAAAQKGLSALAAGQVEEVRTRRTAAEQTYSNVLNRLGAPGTYDLPGQPSLLGGDATASPATGTEGIFKTEKAKSGHATDIDRRYQGEGAIQDITSLDPEKTTKAIEGSSQFRTMSRLTAEAEQLVARKGELYDEMLNNLQLPIIEGSAAVARENAEALKRSFARGGSARRTALETVEKIRSQERINSAKVQQLSQVRFGLDQWSRQNAQNVLQFGQSWASNLGGVRDSFNQAMDNAADLMLRRALPVMQSSQENAAAFRAAAHQQKREKLGRWVSGLMGIGMMATGAGFLGGPSGMLGKGLGVLGGVANAAGINVPGRTSKKQAATEQADATEWKILK